MNESKLPTRRQKCEFAQKFIVISSEGNLSCADLLKSQTDPVLKDQKIRRTQKRDVMFELKSSNVGKIDSFGTHLGRMISKEEICIAINSSKKNLRRSLLSV